jgi:predicted DCC family thiol-disulfide oxidoreductase YuxK
MQYLTVLYDAQCGLCSSARRWLERQDLYVPLEFVPCSTPRAEFRFPTLNHDLSAKDVTVVSPSGEIWRGAEAWIVCLWATHRWRGLSAEMSHPGQMHRARGFFEMVGRHRDRIGRGLGMRPDAPRRYESSRAGSSVGRQAGSLASQAGKSQAVTRPFGSNIEQDRKHGDLR